MADRWTARGYSVGRSRAARGRLRAQSGRPVWAQWGSTGAPQAAAGLRVLQLDGDTPPAPPRGRPAGTPYSQLPELQTCTSPRVPGGQQMSRPRVIAMANGKGGVGKTSAATNIAGHA